MGESARAAALVVIVVGSSGTQILKIVPGLSHSLAVRERNRIRPPCFSTMERTSQSPSPVPCSPLVVKNSVKSRPMLQVDARPGIGDGDRIALLSNILQRTPQLDANQDAPARANGRHRVLDKVDEYLPQLIEIRLNGKGVRSLRSTAIPRSSSCAVCRSTTLFTSSTETGVQAHSICGRAPGCSARCFRRA